MNITEIAADVQNQPEGAPPSSQLSRCAAKVNVEQFGVNSAQTRELANVLCDPELIARLVQVKDETLPAQERQAQGMTDDINKFFTLFDEYVTRYDAFTAQTQPIIYHLKQLSAI